MMYYKIGNKATLTLADGSAIILDSAASGKLTQQAGAVIQKSTNGQIILFLRQILISEQ